MTNNFLHHIRLGSFFRFCLVGGTSATASVGLLYLLVDIVHMPYLPAFVLAFVLVNACSYMATRRFAFNTSTVDMRAGLLRYFVVTGTSLLMNSILMVVLVEGFGLNPVLANIVLAAVNAPLNFLVHRRVTFGVHRLPQR